jgi:hypothetical protein
LFPLQPLIATASVRPNAPIEKILGGVSSRGNYGRAFSQVTACERLRRKIDKNQLNRDGIRVLAETQKK